MGFGGKPDSAMGGGSEVLKLDDALAKVDNFVAEKLGSNWTTRWRKWITLWLKSWDCKLLSQLSLRASSSPAASAASQAFCQRQNLDAGRIHSARADVINGVPARHSRVGIDALAKVDNLVAEKLGL